MGGVLLGIGGLKLARGLERQPGRVGLQGGDVLRGRMREVEGRVWEWIVPSEELTAVKSRHRISATMRRSDGVRVRARVPAALSGCR